MSHNFASPNDYKLSSGYKSAEALEDLHTDCCVEYHKDLPTPFGSK